jgi:hypothetical protein
MEHSAPICVYSTYENVEGVVMNLSLAIPAPLSLRRRPKDAVAPQAPSVGSTADGFSRYLLSVDFEAAGGEQWSSVGGGESVADAIASAREALPLGVEWDVVRWNDLYGE